MKHCGELVGIDETEISVFSKVLKGFIFFIASNIL